MSVDKLVDSTQLDADLTSVADAIREKGGTSAELAFPTDFISAIEAISGGGGDIELLASGDYVQASDLTSQNLQIPATVNNGNPYLILVVKDSVTSGVGQTHSWCRAINVPQEIVDSIAPLLVVKTVASNGSAAYYARGAVSGGSSALQYNTYPTIGTIYCIRYNSSYNIKSGTYHWYVWGIKS